MLRSILLAAATLLASYLYTRLRYVRFKQYAAIPQLPTNILLGHLKAFGEFMQRGIPDRHPDEIFAEMWETLGRPPVMLVDLRPLNKPMVLVTNHEIAEQISKPNKLFPWSITKSPTWSHLVHMTGETSILVREGPDWKELRKKYNPGFTPQHLWSLLPLILEKMEPCIRYLDRFAASGEEFSLETLMSNLTFDIIGAAVMDADFDAQHMNLSEQSELIRLFRELLNTYKDDKNDTPWWLAPGTFRQRKRLGRRIHEILEGLIREKYAESKEQAASKRSRSILALSLQDTNELTPDVLSETADQVRSFLFAGHDSNTGTLEWLFYELSRTPRALQAVRAELDEVLGPDADPRVVCARLAQDGESLLPRLRYASAAVKETLRLHPPAASTRYTGPGSGFTVRAPNGETYCLDGVVIYSCLSIIQRDPGVYGPTADDFAPERWLGDAARDIPASAFRPFERGPRNCIGQELANIESRVIIAIVARGFDFVKVGLGESVLDQEGRPVINEKGQHEVKSRLYNFKMRFDFALLAFVAATATAAPTPNLAVEPVKRANLVDRQDLGTLISGVLSTLDNTVQPITTELLDQIVSNLVQALSLPLQGTLQPYTSDILNEVLGILGIRDEHQKRTEAGLITERQNLDAINALIAALSELVNPLTAGLLEGVLTKLGIGLKV